VVALDCADPRRLASIRDAMAAAPPLPAGEQKNLYWCGAGLNSCSIDPCGHLFVCSQSRAVAWDLRKGTLREGWEQLLRDERATPATKTTRCSRCQVRHLCGMRAANATLEHDDPEKPVEFLCEVTHLRVLAAGAQVPAHGPCPYCDERLTELQTRARSLSMAGGVPDPESAT
jgi:radical SAM protein with 4Fe4S-binding SPASM domain